MGAVFSVNLQAEIKQGHKLALLDSLVSPMSESQIEYLNSKELDMNKLEDVLAYYFAANCKISVDIINDKIDIRVDDDNGDEFYFHSDKEEAEIQFDYLKGSEEPFIEDEIEKFKTSIKETLNFEIQVEVKEEFRDPFYTYNIYDNDVLIVDGTCDLDEGAKVDVINYIEFKNYLESQNLYLDSIEKQIDGFTRYYIVSIGMCGKYDTVDVEVPMDGKAFAKGYYQGVKRSLVDVFKDFVDMDDLMKQFKDVE